MKNDWRNIFRSGRPKPARLEPCRPKIASTRLNDGCEVRGHPAVSRLIREEPLAGIKPQQVIVLAVLFEQLRE